MGLMSLPPEVRNKLAKHREEFLSATETLHEYEDGEGNWVCDRWLHPKKASENLLGKALDNHDIMQIINNAPLKEVAIFVWGGMSSQANSALTILENANIEDVNELLDTNEIGLCPVFVPVTKPIPGVEYTWKYLVECSQEQLRLIWEKRGRTINRGTRKKDTIHLMLEYMKERGASETTTLAEVFGIER
jgi:hypothetical protein